MINNMDLYLNLMPDLRNIVTSYFGDVIFLQSSDFSQSSDLSQAQDAVNEVTFATAEEFKKSKATNCHFINYEIKSTDHVNNPDIPKTLLRCSGVPKIKTHTLALMFKDYQFNGDISQWDVSNATSMEDMFVNSQFNGDLSKWDVSNVTNMSWMFNASEFKGNISQWDVSFVTDMRGMFNSSQFDGDISQWDVSSVTDMRFMFFESQFNGDLYKWDVSNVTKMNFMFNASQFDGDISQWDVSSVINMSWMFANSQFNNSSLLPWDVSSVTDMSYLFAWTKTLNIESSLQKWNITKKTNIRGMFVDSNIKKETVKSWANFDGLYLMFV